MDPTPQQHANWIAQAREHWKDNLPKMYARLVAAHELETALQSAANATAQGIRVLMEQGQTWEEAWEEVRGFYLFPQAEPDADPQAPPSEGFKANSELIQGLDSLTMPGEKEEPEGQ